MPRKKVTTDSTLIDDNNTITFRKKAPKEAVAEAAAQPAEKPTRRTRTKTVERIPEPVIEPSAVVQAEAVPEKKPRSRTRKVVQAESDDIVRLADENSVSLMFRPAGGRPAAGKPASRVPRTPEPAKTPEPKAVAFDSSELEAALAEHDLTLMEWRSKTAGAPRETRSEEGEQPRSRRSRRERGRKGPEGTQPSPAVVEPATDEQVVEEPKPVGKAVIPVPANAPQVVLRHGIPTLVRNGTVFPPLAFFGAPTDEGRAKNVFQEMEMAGKAGIHLHSLLVELAVDREEVGRAVNFGTYLMQRALQADPDAQVIFRVVFVAPQGWEKQYPQAVYKRADGGIADPSLSDEEFWEVAQDCLMQFVEQMNASDHRKQILGLHLERGEWFHPQGEGYDTSKAATRKFRDWARARYRSDVVSLRAAWFDGSADFDRLEVPQYVSGDEKTPAKFVRANRKERKWVDYHLFLSDQSESRIAELAYACKQASGGYFLVGVSYGYTFEWSHPASGHLSLGKMLRNPDIDFIAGPPSYRNREPGGAASFPCPIDSFALNGKLYISEEDFKTSIGTGYQPDDFNPTVKTPQALESMHWRGVGSALVHGSAVCWMDLWGNGWLKTPSVWERAAVVADALVRRMAVPPGDPDVAIFIDERALAYLVDQNGFSLLVQNVRESVMRAGLSSAFYLLSDLQHRESFPESRLYVFLNAWDVRTELRDAIKNRLQRDGKVLFWLYTAGLFDSGRESLERVREITGIALRPQPFHSRTGTTILNRRHPLCEAFPEKTSIGGARLEPSYFAIPEDGTVLGEYTQNGLPSFVLREFEPGDPVNGWKSVFLGEPIVNSAMIQALAGIAGCHTWSFTDDVVHVRPPFLTVHCQGAGPRTIALPDKWSAYDLIDQQWVGGESTSLKFHATDGSTHTFLIGKRQELDQILNIDPSTLLHIDELPEREENTVRFDSFSFDVPIMRLDEWMEGSEIEDISDDLLFKPRILEEEPEGEAEQARVGRRRRNRRNRKERPGGAPGERVHVEDLGMNVMFRKRD